MNRFPPVAPATPSEAPRGPLTQTPLDDVRMLCLPPMPDAFGRLRPPLSQTALNLSLELAYMTYTLDLDPWMAAGWRDISIQVDNRLQSGVTVGESESAASERIRVLMNGWKVARARMAMREANPVAQLMGALRQREKSDTIKAVTMIHPAPGGRFLVAIGFMGTGSRFYDWFSNFRFTTEEGFHRGFYQLTQVYAQSAARIHFPDTAAALGLPSLSLADVLAAMRAPNSRFSLWMAGHSQGAAVMQVFCHQLLAQGNVAPRHVVGYGFASPTVMVGEVSGDPAGYPLYHILNEDDMVPRMGALMHLGMGLTYPADDALRNAAYGWSDDPAEIALRKDAEALMNHIEDTPTMLMSLAALLGVVNEEKTEESLRALMDRRWVIAPLDRAFLFAGDKVKASLARMARYARVAYRAIAGRRMAEETVLRLQAEMRPILRAHTLLKLLAALRDRFYPPHMLRRPHGATGAYGYIAQNGAEKWLPFVWAELPDGGVRRIVLDTHPLCVPADGVSTSALRHATPAARTTARRSARTRGVGALRPRRRRAALPSTPMLKRPAQRPAAHRHRRVFQRFF